jgi:hypothetical protein
VAKLATGTKEWLQGLVGLTYPEAMTQISQARQVYRLFKIDDVLVEDITMKVGPKDIMITLSTPNHYRPSGYGPADVARDRVAASNYVAMNPSHVRIVSVTRGV